MDAATARCLAEVRDELRALRQAVAALAVAAPRVSAADAAAGRHLLPAVARVTDGSSFVVSELVDFAAGAGADAAALRAALVDVTGAELGPGTARRVGWLFRRLRGVNVGGLFVERQGSEASGAVWRVGFCGFLAAETHADSLPRAPERRCLGSVVQREETP